MGRIGRLHRLHDSTQSPAGGRLKTSAAADGNRNGANVPHSCNRPGSADNQCEGTLRPGVIAERHGALLEMFFADTRSSIQQGSAGSRLDRCGQDRHYNETHRDFRAHGHSGHLQETCKAVAGAHIPTGQQKQTSHASLSCQ